MSEIFPAPGTYLWDRLEREIKNSDCVVVLWTFNGSKSQYVNQEIGAAKSFEKKIIPIVRGNQPIVGAIEGLEWIPHDRKTYARLIKRVVDLRKRKEPEEKLRRAKIFFSTVLILYIILFIITFLYVVVF